ncbi:5099_t:CDS:2 [Funneliformis mosseae]|uniref:5099_t:CDS:1 n=1 Tax=Funneliformis mosseae TaxID=27381 RepID=A0A9N8W759_FUNMO|nr:5099_t:CDS:2 [Funneliformis mosseae]
MSQVINVSTNISNSLLLKSNELSLKLQQSYSNAIEEIALEMNVEFINFNEFANVSEIKSDLYGDNVRKAVWKEKLCPVFLKSVPGYSIEDHHKKLIEEIRRASLNQNCENIIQLLGVSEDPSDKSAILVIQHPNDGTLREYLARHPNLEWFKKLNLAKDIAQGIRHLHRSGFVHGDLHAQSVFIDDGKAVIRDPGLFVMGDMKHKPDQRSDIYSLGVILWEISSCKPPFGKSGSQVILTMAIMVRKTREQPVPNTSEEYIQLYQQCWDHEPNLRPNIEQICDQLDGIPYDDPVKVGNSVIIADIRASSEESRKSHDYLHQISSQNSQDSQDEVNQDSMAEKPLPLQVPISKYQDANLSEPISPDTIARMDKEYEEFKKQKGFKKFKSKISKIFKKMSCFS